MRRLTTVLLTLVICSACGGDRAGSGEAGRDGAVSTGTLALLLDVPGTVRAGEEVPIAITLVNRGASPTDVGAVSPDVVVTREDGTEVWRRSRHEPSLPGGATTLRPNEMRGSGSSWNQRDDAGRPVGPGTYRIRAEAPTLELASDAREVTISP
jgi:hypothetical protein